MRCTCEECKNLTLHTELRLQTLLVMSNPGIIKKSFETEAIISPSDVETKGEEDLPQIMAKIVQQIC